jgi:hypothetical protein
MIIISACSAVKGSPKIIAFGDAAAFGSNAEIISSLVMH